MTDRRITLDKPKSDNPYPDRLREIAGRMLGLSYREMQTLAELVHNSRSTAIDGPAGTAEALLDAASLIDTGKAL